jgi:fructose-specific component phosphotransferase system IIB-like protein
MEFARAQSGHCRSSNITIATFAPRGSFNADASAANAQALEPSAASKIMIRLIDTLMNDPKFQGKAVFPILRENAAFPIALARSSEVKL